MSKILYATLGVAAIALSWLATAYSGVISYEHFLPRGQLIALQGPLMGVLACALLAIVGLTWRTGWVRALVFGVLGLAAATVSASIVIERTIATQAAAVQAARDANHPLSVAEQALEDAKVEAKAAADEAKAECQSGHGKRCKELEQREQAARERREVARTKLATKPAKVIEDPAGVQMASVIGISPVTYRLLQSASPGTIMEIVAPLLSEFGAHMLRLAFGVAPQSSLQSKVPAQGLPAQEPLQRMPEPVPESKPEPARKRGRKKAGKRASYGTRAYWLARLDRKRPDLARLVRAGELSANMAAIMAGWRKTNLKLVASN
jgi:hypothetical protein